MRLIVSVLVALIAFTGAALADPFANFYGNTVKVAGPAGERLVFIDEGGTYSQKLPDGSTAEGKYEVNGDTEVQAQRPATSVACSVEPSGAVSSQLSPTSRA